MLEGLCRIYLEIGDSGQSLTIRPENTGADSIPLPSQVWEFIRASKAENTLRGYQSDWRDLCAWCESQGGRSVPAACQCGRDGGVIGKDGLTVTLRRSKTDQAGEGRRIGIPYGSNPETCPVLTVQARSNRRA
jgi:hypothetical protein